MKRLDAIGNTLTAVALVAVAGCQQALPTAEDDNLIPIDVTTLELRLPFEDFTASSQVFGGFGRASELGNGFIASAFGDSLQAATLLRFGRYPEFATVVDTLGTSRPDSALTFLEGRIVARFDTAGSVLTGPVQVTAHALTEAWDGVTATWESAVDSSGALVPWSVAGGGAVESIGSTIWDPADGDSLVITVDSARLSTWTDTLDFTRGVRLTTTAPGTRLQLTSALLWLSALPSVNPDTIIDVLADNEALTFIYDPLPPPPPDGLRVGGAPAWRSILELDLPTELNGPPELCAAVGCPVAVTEEVVSFAALRLTSRATLPAFAPSDTLSMDLRMVLAPELLPKSPLGPSNVGIFGELLPPEPFSTAPGTVIELPVTGLIRDLIRGETLAGDPVSPTVALLSQFEPLSLEFVSFEGPGSVNAPELRVVFTFSNGLGG